MPDNDPDILAQFQEFLTAKAEQEKENEQSEDFEVEIWDEKGRGVRTRRSHAKPFLQSLGIDIDADPGTGGGDNKGDGGSATDPKTGRQSKGKSSNTTGTQSVARKYFVKQAGK